MRIQVIGVVDGGNGASQPTEGLSKAFTVGGSSGGLGNSSTQLLVPSTPVGGYGRNPSDRRGDGSKGGYGRNPSDRRGDGRGGYGRSPSDRRSDGSNVVVGEKKT